MDELSFDEECYQYWHIVPWELIANELAILQLKGKITGLRYRPEKGSGCFIVNFTLTDKYEWPDLFNIRDDYEPADDEEKKEWFYWT